MVPEILIPTMRPAGDIRPLLGAVGDTAGQAVVIASCLPGSASFNRNACLDQAKGELLIMLDDDMDGFYRGWVDDLIRPMLDDPGLAAVSARLVKPDGTLAHNCSDNYDIGKPLIEVGFGVHSLMPTACFAFRDIGLRFDEKFRGSGWEDNDFFRQYAAAAPTARFAINNQCRLIHRNEMKNQHGKNWDFNKAYYCSKWGIL